MSSTGIIKSVLSEYGIKWATNRILYSAKLESMRLTPAIEKLYEKKTVYPKRLDIFDLDINSLRTFICSLDDKNKEELIGIADKVSEGVITGFSSVELDYGNPMDWQMNPLTGKRCDETKKWYQIPDFDKKLGDIKVIWEASRFSHFLTLARAYLLTSNEKYYRVFSDQLKSWLDNNQYSYGANFKCGQECSLRMVNALLAYTVFKKSSIATDVDASNVKDLIDRCYRKILSNFFYAYKCIKNNHTISELMGMIVGAWCCEDEKQLQKAYRLLDEVIDEQFTDDGGYRQFSFNYQRLALQDLEVVMSIAETTKKCLNQKSLEKVKNAAFLMYQCQDESGDMPNYGSNDGALVFPVTSCGYRDFRPVINTCYALSAGNQLYETGIHQEELIWFGGKSKFADYKIEKIERGSNQFVNAGLFTIRKPHSWAMIVANDYKSRPAHMDQLHFDLWVRGKNVLCDAGTYSYADDIGRQMVNNESHNTAMVESIPQMNIHGPFMIMDWTDRKLTKGDNSAFEGTVLSKNGYTHKRRVSHRDNVYIISDVVDVDAFILFHTPFDVELDNNKARIYYNEDELCVIKCEGTFDIREAKRSLYYLKGEKTSCIAINAGANKELKTVIEIGVNGND